MSTKYKVTYCRLLLTGHGLQIRAIGFGWEDVCEARSYESIKKVEKMINDKIR